MRGLPLYVSESCWSLLYEFQWMMMLPYCQRLHAQPQQQQQQQKKTQRRQKSERRVGLSHRF